MVDNMINKPVNGQTQTIRTCNREHNYGSTNFTFDKFYPFLWVSTSVLIVL